MELRSVLTPARTVLLLGAGASVPSGAPSGPELATILWNKVAHQPAQTDDLVDTASILERNYGRRAVVDVIIDILTPLVPTGGLLALPRFGWSKLYTTNYDRLLEGAYEANNIPLTTYRSNFDFSTKLVAAGTALYKIHGCISEDRSIGTQASMIITERDYDANRKYRQSLFHSLAASFHTQDVLILGHSLRDKHLADLMKEVLSLHDEGMQGKIFALVYDKDDLRAPLFEDRGVKVAFGGIDEFVNELVSGHVPSSAATTHQLAGFLPPELVPVTLDVRAQQNKQPNVRRMFNGGAASYADIKASATFERTAGLQIANWLNLDGSLVAIITGSAGVGKTTLARQVLSRLAGPNVPAWEHQSDFPFQYRYWLDVESALADAKQTGVLFVDECTHYLRALNQLLDRFAESQRSNLKIVVTANAAQWTPRIKSPAFFNKGKIFELSKLDDPEIHSLISLLEANSSVAALVQSTFRSLKREEQYRTLSRKSAADMFVCLKNIFATQSLDIILLEEYEQLDLDLQDYYRYVAALEAIGARVHRQLVIRMLDIPTDQVAAILARLTGIIDEYDISPRDGIYGWQTRHLIIARKITEYKFSGLEELTALFKKVVTHLNPANAVELQSVRDLCDMEFGIERLPDANIRRQLYRDLIAVAPGERIPWHRLMRELLDMGALDDAEQELRNAEDAVNADAPLDRYRVRLLIARSKQLARISEGDRIALLRTAYETAMKNIERHKWDKVSYYTLCDTAVELVNRGQSEFYLTEAVSKLRLAADRILDPEIPERIRTYERIERKRR